MRNLYSIMVVFAALVGCSHTEISTANVPVTAADGGDHSPPAVGAAGPSSAGHSGALSTRPDSGAGGVNAAADGGGAAAGAGAGQPVAGTTAPAPTSGSGGPSQSSADGGRSSVVAGNDAPDLRPYPAINFAGLTSALELAPVRIAATGLYPAKVTISSGGVDNLFSSTGALVASNAETQALRVSVQHPNLRIIFTICEGLYRIVAKRSAGIQILSDLKGKRIATAAGTSSAYYLAKMLETANLTEHDVTVVNQMPGMGVLSADAATIWEPGIQYVSDTLKDDAIEFQNGAQGETVYRELFNLHATAESLLDPDKRRAIVRFVAALITASAQLERDPTQAFSLLTGPTGAGLEVLQRSWKYERFAGGLVPDLLDVITAEEVWRAKLDNRSTRPAAELASLIDDSIVKEASAGISK